MREGPDPNRAFARFAAGRRGKQTAETGTARWETTRKSLLFVCPDLSVVVNHKKLHHFAQTLRACRSEADGGIRKFYGSLGQWSCSEINRLSHWNIEVSQRIFV